MNPTCFLFVSYTRFDEIGVLISKMKPGFCNDTLSKICHILLVMLGTLS